MAKLKPVRNPAEGVPRRGNRVGNKKPVAKEHPRATYLFTVRVQGYPVPVFLTLDFSDPEITGEYVQVLDEIYISGDPNMSRERRADTTLHEVLHAVSHIALAPKDRLNERQVNTLATVLMETFRRSPEFTKYILKGVR